MAESIRSFIAVELPDIVKQELTDLENLLKKRCPEVVKWVGSEGIHLTLKFLGAVDADRINEVNMAMDEAVEGMTPFGLEVGEVGAFPNLTWVQVIWVGVRGELDKLMYLQKRVESNMEQLGFTREERAFTAHLTLGRVRNYTSPEDRRRIGQILGQTSFASTNPVRVETIDLMKSQLTSQGAIYTRLYAAQLKGEVSV